jgi:hypothetical protein
LAECANESIGLQINNVEISEYDPTEDTSVGRYEGKVDAKYSERVYVSKQYI